ncbi:prolyl 4-hydroxylase subunit alpha-3 [Rhinatrema bivittatum]|uniref:prolyl 4-hydroxylase subunit alpha-3 n=1 Tax=Rhinatrema bivittatum TaxID=194408 RepID=UPI00112B08D5|nr:prolyl 4-hydroxylase subunit alpha-3 [Rhinatrema bivittatum]
MCSALRSPDPPLHFPGRELQAGGRSQPQPGREEGGGSPFPGSGMPSLLGLGLRLLLLLKLSRPDVFSSMSTVRRALATEGRLLRLLHSYLQGESSRLEALRRFYEKVHAVHQEAGSTVTNPVLAFTLIKRLQSGWMNIANSLETSENIQVFQNGYKTIEEDLPKAEDLEGAAQALMRLQDVYSLSVKGLVNGLFQRTMQADITEIYRPAWLIPLSADDCFHIGKVAYEKEDYYHSIQWLEEAVSLFRSSYGNWFTEERGSLEGALDYLAFSYFKVGNISYALNLSREFLHYDPENERVASNVQKYEKLLAEKSPSAQEEVIVQRSSVTHLQTREAYEGLCQTLGSQPTHYRIPSLLCSYETNNSPYLVLQPMRREIVSLHPHVVLYHDFISEPEAARIKEIAAPWLKRSVVAAEEKQVEAEYRISKSAWLKDTVDPVIRKLDMRIGALTGLNIRLPYAEYLQVVNYGIGGHYEPHFDHATSRNSPLYRTNAGNRVATFMVYLSSVEAGGSTAFIYANFSVPVLKNAALFWWNLHRNGEGDEATLHAGCPVLIGDKWVANKWIHEYGQEFRRQCGSNPED